ncbi:multidrug resistance protein fnx1 [Pyrenophora tritici-repentis Pt-1C-BFP]|uniref:Multidrug resistance protein fnx1 n=1 Tax=Pyrenophora tritici-repentis (strain Pt-1C-BFP) TaxID=426418 RepID=B2WPB8_PYRTR|nr:multidrug resistance protein fnx1 [Pyrenophora tritici-repentis Pt-1C-BFP]EDU45984.1 multidrug resistance protein fnx1 [Pyrenophora tritici-repentis Pt-1C-BFP]
MTVAIYGKVGSDLNALSHINWLATAYFLTLTVIQGIGGGGMTSIVVYQRITLAGVDRSNCWMNLQRIDFLGAIILVAANIGLLIGMNRGSNVSWTSPITIVSLTASLASFLIFGIFEAYVAAEPLVPLHVIFDSKMVACYACLFFGFGSWIALIYNSVLFFQADQGVSATAASIRLIPPCICGVSGSFIGGWFIRRTGKFYWTIVFAYSLMTTALAVVFVFSRNIATNTGLMIVGISMCAFSNGMGTTGTLIGINIEQIIKGVQHSLEFIQTLEPDIQKAVRDCYGWSINLGFTFIIGMASFAFFSAFFRLRRAYLGLSNRCNRAKPPALYRLNESQDFALERYLNAIDNIGFGIHRGLVEQQANSLLEDAYTGLDEVAPKFGKLWARRWLARHPKYRRVKAKSIEVQRKLAQEPATLLDWYTRLKDLIEERGILPEDIYNMDETGCRIGVAKEQYLYTKNGRTVFIHNANNRELITLVECIRATGEVIPPLIIVKAATVMEHWIVVTVHGVRTS